MAFLGGGELLLPVVFLSGPRYEAFRREYEAKQLKRLAFSPN